MHPFIKAVVKGLLQISENLVQGVTQATVNAARNPFAAGRTDLFAFMQNDGLDDRQIQELLAALDTIFP